MIPTNTNDSGLLRTKEPFFTKEKAFYKKLFYMILLLALQNLVAYSINMIDNIMLGSYSQVTLSAASSVNQIFFMVQQFALSFANALVVLASQYWGKQEISSIRILTGTAMKAAFVCGIIFCAICSFFPVQLLSIFTNSQEIIREGIAYLNILQWSFAIYLLTCVFMAALRSVGIVNISFCTSVVSLAVNGVINYLLIFGRFGFPELGIVGAAVGTIIARCIELLIVLVYTFKFDKKIRLSGKDLLSRHSELSKDYGKILLTISITQVLWGISVPIQTAILGHLSDNAIAANSVATTFYQYLKVVIIAISSASAVLIGNSIGKGEMNRIRSDARTLCAIDVLIGIVLAVLLYVLRTPLLSHYKLTDEALVLADHLMIIMSIVMVGMSYQMPVSSGIIQGAGDTKFTMAMNMISLWGIAMPLSFMAAFWWKLPVEAVVLLLQSDQIFKGIPTFIRFRSYKWIKKMTK